MRQFRLALLLLLIVPLLVGLSGCQRQPKPSPEELAAQYRTQAEAYLVEKYPGLIISVKQIPRAYATAATVEVTTLLLGRECEFQVSISQSVVSDNLIEQAKEFLSGKVWEELHVRYDDGSPVITSCTIKGNDSVEFSMEAELPGLGAKLPFTLTLTPQGSTDNLLPLLQARALELCQLYLERTYHSAYEAKVVGEISTTGKYPTVPASMNFMGEAVNFEMVVRPSSVRDDLTCRLTEMNWFTRAAAWTYSPMYDCPGHAPMQAGKPLTFFDIYDGWVRVYAGFGNGDGGLLPLWYLTRDRSNVIPSHQPALFVMKEGAVMCAAPVQGSQTISAPIEGQLVQVSAEHDGFSYGRYQLAGEHNPVAGWIPTSELVPFTADVHPVIIKTVLEQLEYLVPGYFSRYALFQPSVVGKAYLDGSVARIDCQLSVLDRLIEFRVTYDGLYSDNLQPSLDDVVVYPRMALTPLGNEDYSGYGEFKPGQALDVLSLAAGGEIGAWAGGELPWALVSNGRLRGWLPIAYLAVDAADQFESVKPYELVVSRKTSVLLLPGKRDTVETLTPGRVAQVRAQHEDMLYVAYFPYEAVPWVGGWVSKHDLQAFDPALSKEGILVEGALVYNQPGGPDGWGGTEGGRVWLGEERDGWIHVSAVGGVSGWTELKNVISRNPWRLP